jgi:hypothetical protein
MCGDTLGAVGLLSRADAVEIHWGLWGFGAELMCGDMLEAVWLRSRADVWRYAGSCGAAEQS